ncbi:MAG TPA: hypothetical protein DCE41_37855 [Cytophagales bacterium]|nr:hypothetical protein [Cytophagales bacterium]HAA18706.1 hypothetical protein [Cytophagales bacterium]HAP61561.1 hypothetical protein [Cytophagales bacterium]
MAKKGKPESTLVSEEDYLNKRLMDQMNWYDRKSIANQQKFKNYKAAEIILGAMIPLLIAFPDIKIPLGEGQQPLDLTSIIVASIGVAIVILGGLLSLNKYEENYVSYRTSAEKLKSEKWRYQTRTNPYQANQRFDALVNNVEKILTEEHNAWVQYQQEEGEYDSFAKEQVDNQVSRLEQEQRARRGTTGSGSGSTYGSSTGSSYGGSSYSSGSSSSSYGSTSGASSYGSSSPAPSTSSGYGSSSSYSGSSAETSSSSRASNASTPDYATIAAESPFNNEGADTEATVSTDATSTLDTDGDTPPDIFGDDVMKKDIYTTRQTGEDEMPDIFG